MKIKRYMNIPQNWIFQAEQFDLEIKNIQAESTIFYESQLITETDDSFYIGSFDVFQKSKLLSTVRFMTLKEHILHTEDSSKATTEIQTTWQLDKMYQDIFSKSAPGDGKQTLFMGYLNEQESKKFQKEVGDPVIIIQKEIRHENQFIYYEEELASIEAYIFKEVTH